MRIVHKINIDYLPIPEYNIIIIDGWLVIICRHKVFTIRRYKNINNIVINKTKLILKLNQVGIYQIFM